jgi:hypothetical protein
MMRLLMTSNLIVRMMEHVTLSVLLRAQFTLLLS